MVEAAVPAERSGGGDLADITAVFTQYGKRCFSLALHLVRDRHLAEDVVQDVFESLFCNPDRYDPLRGTVATWVLTLTHHRAVDVLRSHARKAGRDNYAGVEYSTALPDNARSPEELACLSDESRRVRAAVLALPALHREVIVRAYFGGQTQPEIAQALAIPLGTVKSRMNSGMLKLSTTCVGAGVAPRGSDSTRRKSA